MTAGGTLAIFESLTGGEVIMVSVFALIVLGPERLPEVARSAGEWITKLKQLTGNLQGEMQEVLDDPAMQPIREVGEFVAQPRKKLSEIVASAEQESRGESAPTSESTSTSEATSLTEPAPTSEAPSLAESAPTSESVTPRESVETSPSSDDGGMAAVEEPAE